MAIALCHQVLTGSGLRPCEFLRRNALLQVRVYLLGRIRIVNYGQTI